jgi:type IVB pilus formation R64 PilN family outer membrane protein
MMRSIIKLMILLLAGLLVAGCVESNKAFRDNNNTIAKTQKNIQDQKVKNESSPVVATNPGFYADTNPVTIVNNPGWLHNRISFKGENLPFSYMLQRILRNTNAIITYRPGIQRDKPVSIDYTGPIKGALDNLAVKTDYAYNILGKQIIWSNLVTKTFDISFMPGSVDYMVGQTEGAHTSSQQRGDISSVVADVMTDQQYSSLKGSVSVWNDLKNTLDGLKSKEGTVDISESTTSVLVHDHPANVRAMAKYINELNQVMSRQVELKVKVLDIDLNKDYQYGIDWNIIGKALGTKFTLGTAAQSFQQIVTSAAIGGATVQGASLKIGETSNALIQALSEQGNVSVVTEPTVVTLNNQVAEIRITTDISYLQEMDTTIAGGSDLSSTTMTPGVVTSGFMLYVLPKIQGNRIYLQVSSVIAQLKSLDTINSNGQINPTGNGNNQGQQITVIQIPTLAQKRFNMRSVVNNGESLIIAGFKQLKNQTKERKGFDTVALGGRGSGSQDVETVILITPTIIENNS